MRVSSEPDDQTLYVRWEPEGAGFAVEMRLDVIGRLQNEVESARETAVEIGGVFLGQAPQPSSPVLRIDDVVPVLRRPEDGPIFMLDPGEHDRFLTTRWDARSSGLQSVGFFRTHVRSGPLRISLADRTLVTGHFTQQAMLVMLVQAKAPHRAAVFAGRGALLPVAPVVPEFVLDRSAFESLPAPERGAKPGRPRIPAVLFWLLCAVVLVGVAAVAYRTWSDLSRAIPGAEAAGPALHVTNGPLLTITWNHYASNVKDALSGKLTIVDGNIRRDVPLGPDALQLGAAEYQPATNTVVVTLTLAMRDATNIVQSVTWRS